jgi:hypothetical protein
LKLMLHEDELDDEDASGSKKKVGK